MTIMFYLYIRDIKMYVKQKLTHDVEPGTGPDGSVVESGPDLALEDGVIAEADIVDLERVLAGVV